MGAEYVLTGSVPDEVWPLVSQFHYSRRMPSNIQHCYAFRVGGGLFGDTGQVVGAAVFTIPPTRWSEEVIELARLVRHPDHEIPLSKLLSFSCHWLKKGGHHLAVSFADWTQKHHGGVYQASGWSYAGKRDRTMDGIIIDGIFKPGRSCNSQFGTRSPEKLREKFPSKEILPHYDDGKHLYWKALSVAGKTRAKRLRLGSLNYPKPIAASPSDEQGPPCLSEEHPLVAAPIELMVINRGAA